MRPRRRVHPGAVAALFLIALVGGAMGALLSAAGERNSLAAIGPYLWRTLAFSTAQAGVSTVLSLVLGACLALALARRRFPGHALVVAALGAASVMPAIVVVFATLMVYGRSGWVAEGWGAIGGSSDLRIFGWPGILIAHVFLNASFACRIYLEALRTVPAEHWRLAAILNFGPTAIFRQIDWPVLRRQTPGLAGLIFLLCFTSFAIVLNLGGGPSRATLEVAIFEALRSDLDFARAAWLALLQLALCVALTVVVQWAVSDAPIPHTIQDAVDRPDRHDRRLKILDAMALAVGSLLVGPILAGAMSGIRALPGILDAEVARAAVTSFVIAAGAGAIACGLATALAAAARQERQAGGHPRLAALLDHLPTAMLALPPFALAAGLFLLLRRVADPSLAGYALLPLINGLGALPFAYRFIAPALMTAGERYGRLGTMLGLSGAARLRIVDWPLLARPFGAAFAMTMALSFGDFGIVALFGGSELRTLPYLLFERLGAYRLEEAGAIGILLVGSAFGLAYLSSRWADADR